MLSTAWASGLVEMSGWVTVTELNLACVVLTADRRLGLPRLLRAAPSLPAGRGRQAGADRHAHPAGSPHAGRSGANQGVGQHPTGVETSRSGSDTGTRSGSVASMKVGQGQREARANHGHHGVQCRSMRITTCWAGCSCIQRS